MNNRAMRKIRQPQFPSGIGGCFVSGRRLMVFGGTRGPCVYVGHVMNEEKEDCIRRWCFFGAQWHARKLVVLLHVLRTVNRGESFFHLLDLSV